MIQLERLRNALEDAGFQGDLSVYRASPPNRSRWPTATTSWNTRPDCVVRLDWAFAPTPAERARANNIIRNHNPAKNEEERIEEVPVSTKTIAALARVVSAMYAAWPDPKPAVPAWAVRELQRVRQAVQNQED